MSLFSTTTITCTNCEEKTDVEAAGSVNADRRPDLREAILDNSFQTLACPSCGETLRLEPMFNYLDVGSGLWLAAYPPRQLGEFVTLTETVRGLFDESYGPEATQSAQEVGAELTARLTFGWPAAREKVLLCQEGLDDVTIEMLKMDLLRRLPDVPLRPGIELRVVGVSETALDCVWTQIDTEEVMQEFEVSRDLLAEIENNPEAWAPLRASLDKGMFVDMQKLFLDVDQDAA